ncbi:MAG: PH domain-containing protein [Bacteroidia bacterium]|nr:PH domain-containing protein [Bacteroidia bacterium]
MEQNSLLFKATFNPIIKTYILLYVGFILLLSVLGIPLLLIWFLGFGQWYSKHYFEKLECELSEKNLRFRKGILLQVEKTIPLENIQDLTFVEGPLLRALHLTVIKIETAGQGHHQGNEMSLIGIMDAALFRNKVLEQRLAILKSRGADSQSDTLAEIAETLKSIEKLLRTKVA